MTDCRAPQNRNEAADRSASESVARRFYELQENGNLENATRLYSKNAQEQTASARRISFLRSVRERLGDKKEITLESWEAAQTAAGSAGKACCELVYQVIRSKRVARETFHMTVEGDSLRINSYTVNSDGLVLSDTGEAPVR